MMENNGKNKKQVILSLIGISLLILFSIGITLAFFNYTKVGSRNNVLNTVDLNFSFEDSDWIWLENAYPMSKEEALTLETTGNESVVDVDGGIAQFKVTAAHSSGAIHYILSLVKENITSTTSSQNNLYTLDPSTKIGQLPDGAVSINLQTSTSDIFETTGLVLDTSGLSIANNSFDSPGLWFVNTNNGVYISNLPVGDLANEKVLGEGVISGTEKSRYFELRMWVNDKVMVDDALRIDCLSRTSQSDVNNHGYGYCSYQTPNLPTGIRYVYSSGEFAKLYYSNRIKIQTSNIESGLIDPTPKMTKTLTQENTPLTEITTENTFSPYAETTAPSGLYLMESTRDNTYPIYYYRGNVATNNVIFAGFCWNIIRTTDSGGMKLIYSGTPTSGHCSASSQNYISNDTFSTVTGLQGTSLIYDSNLNNYETINVSSLSGTISYGNDVTWDGTKYTLVDKIDKNISNINTDYNDTTTAGLRYHHYTCLNNQSNCTSIKYIYRLTNTAFEYITLSNGDKIDDFVNKSLHNAGSNNTKSNILQKLEQWYLNNLNNYSDYLEDTVFCNDRRFYFAAGWDKDKTNTSTLQFAGDQRMSYNYSPSLYCDRADSYTVSSGNGNGLLRYPIGLITLDELILGGVKYDYYRSPNYFGSNSFWTMTPTELHYTKKAILAYRYNDNDQILSTYNDSSLGIRPVISLHKDVEFESGTGARSSPYIVKEIELEK